MPLSGAVKEPSWLGGLIGGLRLTPPTATIFCDSQSAIHWANHHIYHERTKHIDVKYYFIRDVIESKKIQVLKIATEDNLADMFTKS